MSISLSRRNLLFEKGTPAVRPALAAEDYLEAAKQAAHWIDGAAQETPDGITWRPEPDHPEKAISGSPLTLYRGNAGIVLFFLQLGQVTQQEEYLRKARRGADLLTKQWPSVSALPGGPFASPYSLYNGLSGIAFTLLEAWKQLGDVRYRDAASAITREIVTAAKPARKGVTWSGSPALGSGDSGVVLYLLYAADRLGNEAYKRLAAEAGRNLVDVAQQDARGGVRWFGISNPEQAGFSNDLYFPNFEIGTAGTAYALVRLYQATGERTFLSAAEAGALHLQKIATVKDDAALIYYREPDLTSLYYLGYCHGPTGTARLFYELYGATKNAEYLAWTEKLARGIIASGVPEKEAPGFWYVVCQCCGSAGTSDFFLGLWAATGKVEYRDIARRFTDQLLSRGTNFDGKGYRWYQAWTRVKPAEVNAETGYMIGASGEAAALLHLYLAVKNRYSTIALPDNPFPAVVHA